MKTHKLTRRLKRNLFISFILLLAAGGGLFFGWRYLQTIRYPTYDSFGIKLPANYSVHGIDVSRYQGKIDWERVAEMRSNGTSVQFAFVKATEGTSLKDPQFHRNFKELKKYSILQGAYHYFHPALDPAEQASHFIREVELCRGNLLPVCDIEDSNGLPPESIRKNLRIFLSEIEKHYKIKPIIYTYVTFYQNYLDGHFDDYPLWIAHYAHEQRFINTHKRAWKFWQHSEAGHIDGINHFVDFNVFNGDIATLKAMCIK